MNPLEMLALRCGMSMGADADEDMVEDVEARREWRAGTCR